MLSSSISRPPLPRLRVLPPFAFIRLPRIPRFRPVRYHPVMPRPIPHTIHARWPDRPDTRYAGTIQTDSPEGCEIAFLGMPDDTGIKLNNGRPGANDGPAAFRRALAHYGTAAPEALTWPVVYDAGNVPAAGHNAKTLAETHGRVTEAVGAILDAGLFPIGIGGGHDLSFPFIRALAERITRESGAEGRLEVVAFDPHLDVREEVGSGMPFRALVEQCGIKTLHNFGANPLVNAREHTAWFAAHGGTMHPGESFDAFFANAPCDLAVSFDLDLLDAAYAPGVSAMNPYGWTPAQATAAVLAAGRCPRVRCFDIMELSPPNDHADRTSRLAAHLFLTFLRGYAQRGNA